MAHFVHQHIAKQQVVHPSVEGGNRGSLARGHCLRASRLHEQAESQALLQILRVERLSPIFTAHLTTFHASLSIGVDDPNISP